MKFKVDILRSPPAKSYTASHDDNALLSLADDIDLHEILQLPRRALAIPPSNRTPLRTAVPFPSPPCPDLIPSTQIDTHMTSDSDENHIPTPESLNYKRKLSEYGVVPASKRSKTELRTFEDGVDISEPGGESSRPNVEDARHPSPAPSSSSESNPIEDEEQLDRIRTAISYTRVQLSAGSVPAVTDYFTFSLATPTEGLTLLRRAHNHGFATLISFSPAHETYSIGIPPGPASKKFGGLYPQWWVGLSRGETKAGPFRDAADVRRAEGDVKGMLKRREKSEKSGKIHSESKIVAEGLRRQAKGLRMWDDEGRESKSDNRKADEKKDGARPIPSQKMHKRTDRRPIPVEKKQKPARRVRFEVDSDDSDFNPWA